MHISELLILPTKTVCLGAVVTGFFSHIVYFIRNEHHMEAPYLLALAFMLPMAMLIAELEVANLGLLESLRRTSLVTISYLGSLYSSIVLYRLLFHPLRRFPGPLGYKISKLWHVTRVAARLDNFHQLDELHRKYGDFVRTGPSEVSIFDPDAVPIILGPRSRCSKAPWYDVSLPLISMHTARDKKAHDKRRRLWDHGFGASALRNYEKRVLGHSKGLLKQLQARTGKSINVNKWFHFYSFDVMADIAFGKSFGMVESGTEHFALDLLREGMEPLGLLGPVPWAFMILARIPGLGSGYKRFVAWAAEQVQNRMKMDSSIEEPDLMSWLIDSYQKSPSKADEIQWLNGDSRLIIVAGSDTTASTLTFIFFRLAQNPLILKKLQKELTALVGNSEEIQVKTLQDAELLNAVINETLRLHPPVPSGTLRVTPPEGIQVGSTFIPGGITVVSPTYTVGRLESCYEFPDEFIPERWSSKPELVKNKTGFAPFSLGSFSCVGKHLALMELRIVVALLVINFDIDFAACETGRQLLEDSHDLFTISPGELNLIFTPVDVQDRVTTK
ncbi:cytochrome P450 monooxygenase-like protein [Xylogone sp. PMI_703]|nr:cytochrome P450 monooxygenase-like protein [Xylogone sp. PMI_703]